MIVFWILALAIAAATAVALVWPLWRSAGRTAAVATAAVVIVGGSAVYAWSSGWGWPEYSRADTPAAMVERLARRLEKEPDDVDGWLLLGRSQTELGQYPLAMRAYQRADRLEGGRNAEAVLGMGEALMLQADGVMDDRMGRLFERALELDPDWGKAQFLAALAAQRRGDLPLAVSRFESMLAAQPPEDVRRVIEAQIAVLRAGGDPQVPSASPSPPVPPQAPVADTDAAPRITVAVTVSPELAPRIASGSTLFVFVRSPGKAGPPLAVKRLPAVLPVKVTLTPADSMMPGVAFAAGDTVEVSAKVSADGSATPKSGDAVGRVTYTVGRDATAALVIDGLTP